MVGPKKVTDCEKNMIIKQKSENVCPKCGKPIVQNASYCAGCGARVFHNEDGAQTADPYVGTIIDNTFEIESILGTGSMGIVYKARHRALDCYVALKVLRQDFIQDRVVLARFQREAQAASSLSHPNVIRIFDYGKTSLNAPYIAMDGNSPISSWIKIIRLARNAFVLSHSKHVRH